MPAEYLQPNGQARAGLATGYADPRYPGQIGSDRIDVRQIHGQRVIGFLAEPESRRGRRGSNDGVDLGESLGEVPGDEGPHLLRLAIVGVIIAGAQRVGAEHDAAFYLGTEALIASVAVHLAQGAGVRRAKAVT